MGTPTTATASANRSKYSRLSSAAVPLPQRGGFVSESQTVRASKTEA